MQESACCHLVRRTIAISGVAPCCLVLPVTYARAQECCACAGINTGVMLFRNTAWSRRLLDELYGYAQLGDEALQEMRAVGR